MLAAAALLAGASGAQAKAAPALPVSYPSEPVPSVGDWTWDTSFTQYNEADRISVSEPQIGVRRDAGEGRSFSVLATVDTISGATPLGTLPLTPNTAPNTVTGPSGRPVNPEIGKVPTTDMSDTRLALSANYESPIGSESTNAIAGNVAKEHDFLSLGGSYTWNRDFNQKNTTFSLGASPEYDVVTPNGGLPFAYGVQHGASEFEGSRKTKYLVGGLVGLTQILNRRTLMQWNYSPTY